MSTEAIFQIESFSSDDTFGLGERFGKLCRGGEVFVLSSDLGGGKTTFTKGLGKGLGCAGIITSPTFNISRVYKCRNNLQLHHFDFYRLNSAGIMEYELREVIDDPKIITAIEWGDVVENVLPKNSLKIVFDRTADNEHSRQLNVTCPTEFAYLLKGIK